MTAIVLDVIGKWSLGYLFVGSMLWMLLIDELRSRKVNFIGAMLWTILLWPIVLFGLARTAIKTMGPR